MKPVAGGSTSSRIDKTPADADVPTYKVEALYVLYPTFYNISGQDHRGDIRRHYAKPNYSGRPVAQLTNY